MSAMQRQTYVGEMSGRFGLFRLALTPMFDGPAADGTPSGAGSPAAAPSGNPGGGAPAGTGSPAAGNPAAPGTSPAGATAGTGQFTYAEDRSNWVPPHRIREATQARQTLEQRMAQYERDLAIERQRVAALSGVQPTAQVDPETAAIRAQFEKVFPELAALAKMKDKLERFAEIDPAELTQGQDHYFTTLGQRTLDSLDAEVVKVLGVQELSPFAQQALHTAFALFVRSDPQYAARYERMDPKLITDFIQEYTNGVLDPYRRTRTTQTPTSAAAPRLPRGGSGSPIAGGGPAKLKPSDTDEYHGAAFRALTGASQ